MSRPRVGPWPGPATRAARWDRSQPPGPAGVELAAAAFICVVAAVGAWVWTSAELSARLASGRWLSFPAPAVPAVMWRLPARLSDPRQAWPAPLRGLLPAGAVMDAIAVTILAAACALVGGVRRASTGRWFGPRWPTRSAGRRRAVRHHDPAIAGARWATRRDLTPLRIRQPAPGRLVVGRSGRHLVATEHRHSVLVLGPTQSGKTTGLAIPAILEWAGPVVATSVKDDLAAATLGWRGGQGSCWVFDPTRSSGLARPAGWSPLAEATGWSGAQRVAAWMVESTPARGGMSDGAFWFAAAAKLLAPLLLAARRGDATMADVVRWTNCGDYDEALRILDFHGDMEAAVALAACAARDDRLRSSVGTTLETVLGPFEDPVVASSTSTIDIDPSALLSGPNSLYLCGPSHEQARVQALFATLVASVVSAAVARANHLDGPLDPPLLLVLDEAANVAPLRDLDTLASTGAGLGMQLVTVCQDIGQLGARYGP
ncbi:MAG: type IV secretory system conjugative DNA transfer family protein, partial [Acidimicrobiales bacterium]